MFAKIFGQILDSSIACSTPLRHFFMDMLILADADGDVDMTPESIAARVRTPLAEVMQHLDCLSKPDPRSRTADREGRRIELLDSHRDWGWHIINYQKFREIASNEQRKAGQRERFKRWKSKTSNNANAPLTVTNASNAMQKQKQKQKYTHTEERVNLPEVNGIPKSTENTIWLKKSLCDAYRRPLEDGWDYSEESTLATIARRPAVREEFGLMITHRTRVGRYFPQSILKILENWSVTLDAARNWKPAGKSSNFIDTIKGPL